MRYRVLGPISVTTDEGLAVPVAGRAEAFLAVLLARAGESVSNDTIAYLIWGGDQPDNPTKAIQVVVSRLRSVAEKTGEALDDLTTTSTGYRLDPGWFDVEEFERLAESDSVVDLRAALDLWAGPPFIGHDAAAHAESTRLGEARAVATERLGEALLAEGQVEESISVLLAFIDREPLRERPRATLMRALYADGRHVQALGVLEEYRRSIGEELGLEPSDELKALEDEILRHDVDVARSGPVSRLEQVRVRFLEAPSGPLAFGSVGEGPKVVVVPNLGVGLSGGQRPFLEAFADRAEVILYDRRGTGLTGGDVEDFTAEAGSRDLEALIEMIGGPVVLLGVSHSGESFTLAHRRPDLVRGILSWASHASGPRTFPNQEFNESVVGLVRSHWGTGSRLLAEFANASYGPEEAAEAARMARYLSSAEAAAGYIAEVYRGDVTELLPDIAAPVLLLHYRGDRMTPFVGSTQLAAGLPNAELIPLEGRRHFPLESDFERIFMAVDRFLDSLPD